MPASCPTGARASRGGRIRNEGRAPSVWGNCECECSISLGKKLGIHTLLSVCETSFASIFGWCARGARGLHGAERAGCLVTTESEEPTPRAVPRWRCKRSWLRLIYDIELTRLGVSLKYVNDLEHSTDLQRLLFFRKKVLQTNKYCPFWAQYLPFLTGTSFTCPRFIPVQLTG